MEGSEVDIFEKRKKRFLRNKGSYNRKLRDQSSLDVLEGEKPPKHKS